MEKRHYPYLPADRSIVYVPEDNLFMREARRAAQEFSTVSNQPVGAVVVLKGKVISRAANRSHLTNRIALWLHDHFCVRRIFRIKTGMHYWVCPGCANYKDHAERRAILAAKKSFGNIAGSDLYLWGHWWCCKPCWDSVIDAGIQDVYLLKGSETLFNVKR